MADKISDFDRGALAVFDLTARLREQLQDFAQELRQTWPWDSVSWDLDCAARDESGRINVPIDLWLELEVDPERRVCWGLELSQDGGQWEISTKVELHDTSEDEAADPAIVEAEPEQFASFDLARAAAPDLLKQLFATRKDVEAHLNELDEPDS